MKVVVDDTLFLRQARMQPAIEGMFCFQCLSKHATIALCHKRRLAGGTWIIEDGCRQPRLTDLVSP